MTSGEAMGMRGVHLFYRMTATKVSRKRSAGKVAPAYLKQKHLIIPVHTLSQGVAFRIWSSRTGWTSLAFMDFHMDFHMAPSILGKRDPVMRGSLKMQDGEV